MKMCCAYTCSICIIVVNMMESLMVSWSSTKTKSMSSSPAKNKNKQPVKKHTSPTTKQQRAPPSMSVGRTMAKLSKVFA
jgi:hypothetical protein